jgi:uncharacterized C2H2 Zn-finger protein
MNITCTRCKTVLSGIASHREHVLGHVREDQRVRQAHILGQIQSDVVYESIEVGQDAEHTCPKGHNVFLGSDALDTHLRTHSKTKLSGAGGSAGDNGYGQAVKGKEIDTTRFPQAASQYPGSTQWGQAVKGKEIDTTGFPQEAGQHPASSRQGQAIEGEQIDFTGFPPEPSQYSGSSRQGQAIEGEEIVNTGFPQEAIQHPGLDQPGQEALEPIPFQLACPVPICHWMAFRWSNLSAHYRKWHTAIGQLHICHECNPPASFGDIDDYLGHYRAHLHAAPRTCRTCTMSYATEADLVQHQQINNHVDGRFGCGRCDAVFTKKSAYDRHRSKTHSFPCYMCPKVFTRPMLLDTHLNKCHGLPAGGL